MRCVRPRQHRIRGRVPKRRENRGKGGTLFPADFLLPLLLFSCFVFFKCVFLSSWLGLCTVGKRRRRRSPHWASSWRCACVACPAPRSSSPAWSRNPGTMSRVPWTTSNASRNSRCGRADCRAMCLAWVLQCSCQRKHTAAVSRFPTPLVCCLVADFISTVVVISRESSHRVLLVRRDSRMSEHGCCSCLKKNSTEPAPSSLTSTSRYVYYAGFADFL